MKAEAINLHSKKNLKDWEIHNLGQLTKSIYDGTHQTPKYVSSGVPFYSVEHVTSNNFVETKYISEEEHLFLTRSFKIEKGDVLMTRIGSVGECKLVDWEVNASFYVSLALLKFPNNWTAEYFEQYSKSEAFHKEVESHSLPSAVPKKINLGPISKIKVLIPSKRSEIEKITKILKDFDEELFRLDKLLIKKKQFKEGITIQLLTGEIRLPGFNEEWQKALVGDVILNYFCGPSPTCEERNIQGDFEWGVLKTTAVTKDFGWNWKAHKTLPFIYWNKKNLEVKIGDVIVTKAGPRHRVGISATVDYVSPRIIVSGKMIGLRVNTKKVLPLILSSCISSKESQLFLNQRTTGMAESQLNFENKALLQTPIKYPKIKEQIAIVTILDDLDGEIKKITQKRKKINLLKHSIMQYFFKKN